MTVDLPGLFILRQVIGAVAASAFAPPARSLGTAETHPTDACPTTHETGTTLSERLATASSNLATTHNAARLDGQSPTNHRFT